MSATSPTRIPVSAIDDDDDDEGFVPSNLAPVAGGRTGGLAPSTLSGGGGAFMASTASYAGVPTAAGGSGLSAATTLSTLDEPVSTTLMRDARNIGRKLKQVLMPRTSRKDVLRDWDLWGPLLLCLTLAMLLGFRAPDDQQSTVFTGVFFIIWFGAGVVTLNSQLLGGRISFFQSVCVLGYCVFPLTLAALVCQFLSKLLVRALIVLPTYGWSVFAAVGFLGDTGLERRKILAVYPIFLFYFVLGWIILITQPII